MSNGSTKRPRSICWRPSLWPQSVLSPGFAAMQSNRVNDSKSSGGSILRCREQGQPSTTDNLLVLLELRGLPTTEYEFAKSVGNRQHLVQRHFPLPQTQAHHRDVLFDID